MPLSVNLLKSLNRSLILSATNRIALCSTARNYSETKELLYQYEKDPATQFINPDVQKLLKSMTRLRLNKVYRKRSVEDTSIEYKFLTTEELEKKFQDAINRAEELLQMPPVVNIKQEEQKIISKDAALDKFSDSKFVITDITYGIKQSKRKVVIRHPDGTLERAPYDVRKRVNQIYFPQEGRKIRVPKMFEPEQLQKCLNEGEYEFILDRVCVQFEPDEKEFHEISSKVYVHINENKKFDFLRSTRHFGPMAFFLAWHKMIDDLLYDMIKRDLLRNGVELIVLMSKLNKIECDEKILGRLGEIPESNNMQGGPLPTDKTQSNDIHEQIKTAIGKSANDFKADEICLVFIENYVKNKALKKAPLELALQTYRESNEEKKKLYEGLLKAHGVN